MPKIMKRQWNRLSPTLKMVAAIFLFVLMAKTLNRH